MEWQMRYFIQTFQHVIDFHVLDGPMLSQTEPDKDFVKAGFKPPYKAWMDIKVSS